MSKAKIRRFELRLSQEEYDLFTALEIELGINKAEIVRSKILKTTKVVVLNLKELMHSLDKIGSELGRAGNNINQLARHGNILIKQGSLSSEHLIEFHKLFGDYIATQRILDKVMRQIIRLMKT